MVRYTHLAWAPGKPMSRQWHRLLLDVHAKHHVRAEVDSAHRTMSEQLALVRQKGVWSSSNPHGAAFPTLWAPHIRVGRADHAIDFNDNSGNRADVQHAAAQLGVTLTQTVPGEPWHLEANRRQLRRYAKRRAKEIRQAKRAKRKAARK